MKTRSLFIGMLLLLVLMGACNSRSEERRVGKECTS